MKLKHELFYESPVGLLKIITTDNTLINISFFDGEFSPKAQISEYPDVMTKTVSELDLYFSGKLKNFTVKTSQDTTPFRDAVYSELIKIPYGETISYKELAVRVGRPKAIRAVGGANHHNNIVIVVPCHRVIGANGSLTGYGGGLEKKKILLELEKSSNI